MARRQVRVDDIVEMGYQWHQGSSIQGIGRSFGADRKTIWKYGRLSQAREGCRGKLFLEEAELIGGMKALGSEDVSRICGIPPASGPG